MNQTRKLALLFLTLFSTILTQVESKCSESCVALASYYLWDGATLSFIAQHLESDLVNPNDLNYTEIRAYNPNILNPDLIQMGSRVEVPFPCRCLEGEFLGYVFSYRVRSGDSYDRVARLVYSNLTTSEYLQLSNSYPADRIPDQGAFLNVTVNCSCGDRSVSDKYGLFVTYPLRSGESLQSVARESGVEEDLLQRYNPGVDFGSGTGIVYVPGKDKSGTFPPLKSSKGLPGRAIAGISVAVVVGVLLMGGGAYMFLYRNKKYKKAQLLSSSQELANIDANGKSLDEAAASALPGSGSLLTGITVENSVEFSYEELSKATDNFSMSNKIGQGGFGVVFYAELRGEKTAIKKMDMQASREFLAELKVLTHVHHVNLVRLIGYCVEGSLFLVYEYVENGNLSQHLRGTGRNPLPWPVRVKVALDSARCLEYIHEHTVPVYIHRDIKSANILIDKNFRGKVADFGLTKLTDMGGTTRLVGTFGYMPPEYARYGDVSPKVDVYAFGVVLYELISAKEAIVRANDSTTEQRGLVATFENVLNQADPREDLCKLVDPRLGDDYPFDSVYKVAQFARACTHEDPDMRPSMRSVVVGLMTLSSSTEDWDIGGLYENQAYVNLMSGR